MTPADFSGCRLYGILDLGYVEIGAARDMAEALVAGGVDLLQIRGKNQSPAEIVNLARDLHAMTAARGVPLVINDHPEVARTVGAEAVHVGQDDLGVAEARSIAGPGCAVGKSTHTLEQAIAAFREGADYIGFGPLFATPTKPDYVPVGLADIKKVQEAVGIPVFCIGGIKLDNLAEVIEAGARRVVIVSGFLQAPDPADYAHSAKELLNQNSNIKK